MVSPGIRSQGKTTGSMHLVGYSCCSYQRFARDAPCPSAVTSDTVFFDRGNSRAKLYCKWGSDQPSGTATDDNKSYASFIDHLQDPLYCESRNSLGY